MQKNIYTIFIFRTEFNIVEIDIDSISFREIETKINNENRNFLKQI